MILQIAATFAEGEKQSVYLGELRRRVQFAAERVAEAARWAASGATATDLLEDAVKAYETAQSELLKATTPPPPPTVIGEPYARLRRAPPVVRRRLLHHLKERADGVHEKLDVDPLRFEDRSPARHEKARDRILNLQRRKALRAKSIRRDVERLVRLAEGAHAAIHHVEDRRLVASAQPPAKKCANFAAIAHRQRRTISVPTIVRRRRHRRRPVPGGIRI
jgi:hypothetical protein